MGPVRHALEGCCVLNHMEGAQIEVEPPLPVRKLRVGGPDYHMHIPDDCVFEPLAALTAEAGAKQSAGCSRFHDVPWCEPVMT